jgi:hypothetical protein
VKPRYWVVVDDLDGRETHRAELRFQFGTRVVQMGPGLWVSSRGRGDTGLWIAPFTLAPLSASVRHGQLDPIEGWVSRDYGRREPAPVVVYGTTTRLPLRIITLLLPVRQMQVAPPEVEMVCDDRGRLDGLRLIDTDETIHVDDDAIVACHGAR